MKYTIQYDGSTDTYLMDEQVENFIGCHLLQIYKEHGITEVAYSESHMLAVLRGLNIEVELLDENGSGLTW